jgi:hypothetical protein
MKKILMIVLALLITFVLTVPAMAGNEIVLKDGGCCKGTGDVKLKLKMSMPGGFPTWKNERNKQYSGDNPWLIQINQIQELYAEIIYEGGFFNKIYLERGKAWYDKDGHLVVNTTVCMPSGTIMQLLAIGSYGDYELAVDKPSVLRGIDEIYGFGNKCGFMQLHDGTWGIGCGKNYNFAATLLKLAEKRLPMSYADEDETADDVVNEAVMTTNQ